MEPNPSGNAGTDTYLDTEQSLQVRDKQEHLRQQFCLLCQPLSFHPSWVKLQKRDGGLSCLGGLHPAGAPTLPNSLGMFLNL